MSYRIVVNYLYNYRDIAERDARIILGPYATHELIVEEDSRRGGKVIVSYERPWWSDLSC